MDPWGFTSPCVPIIKLAVLKWQPSLQCLLLLGSQSLFYESGDCEAKTKKKAKKNRKVWEWSCVFILLAVLKIK